MKTEPVTLKLDLRERVLRDGTNQLSDAELLAVVLGTGTEGESVRHLSAALLDLYRGVSGLSQTSGHNLSGRRGVGPAKAARVIAGLELGRRALLAQLDHDRTVIAEFESVASWARPRLAALDHEEVWLLMLDGRNGLKAVQRIAQGGQHGCALTARDILRPAVRDGASAIVLVHNHPSGDPSPSPEDVTMTRAVAVACEVVGIPLLDHVVVARQGACSLLDLGVLPA